MSLTAPPTRPAGSSGWRRWLRAPRLRAASMPLEIIPQGLASLELKLSGWGWVRLEDTGRNPSRHWFWNDRELTLLVPVGSRPLMRIGNIWGSRSFQVDARSERQETLVPHSSHFQFRLPDAAAAAALAAPVASPTGRWRASGINAPGNGHWRLHLPTGGDVALPDAGTITMPAIALSAPAMTHLPPDAWNARPPMDDLDRRLYLAALPE